MEAVPLHGLLPLWRSGPHIPLHRVRGELLEGRNDHRQGECFGDKPGINLGKAERIVCGKDDHPSAPNKRWSKGLLTLAHDLDPPLRQDIPPAKRLIVWCAQEESFTHEP